MTEYSFPEARMKYGAFIAKVTEIRELVFTSQHTVQLRAGKAAENSDFHKN
jgi:hypothetical protein